MRPIRLSADLDSTGVIDSDGASIHREATTIAAETWCELQKWVEDYAPVIPMDDEKRTRADDWVRLLDARGLELLRHVRDQWTTDPETGEPVRLLYWSEGRLAYLEPES